MQDAGCFDWKVLVAVQAVQAITLTLDHCTELVVGRSICLHCFQPEQQWSICMHWHGISPTVYSCDWGLNTWVGHMCMHVHEVGLLAVPHWTGCCTGYYSYTWPLHWVGCGSFNLSTLLVCDVVGYNEHIVCSVQYRPRYDQPVVYQDKLLSKVWINHASMFYASLTCHCSMKCTTELFGFTLYPVHTTALFRFSY